MTKLALEHVLKSEPGVGRNFYAIQRYLDAEVEVPDATTLVKGKVQLAGDLAGTADAPTVPGLATKANAAASSARVYRTSHQSIPHNTATAVSFDAEEWDTASLHGAGDPTRLVAPAAGIYVVSAFVLWDAGATGLRQLQIRSNGATLIAQEIAAATSTQQTIAAQVKLAASGYVELVVTHTQGVALQVLGGATFTSAVMTYLGSA